MKPNEVLYAVIAVIGGYVIVSITYRFLRGTVIRRRSLERPTRRRRRRGNSSHTEEHHHHHHHVPHPDLTHIYIMGDSPTTTNGSNTPQPPHTVPDTLPPLASFKASSVKQLTETTCGICLDTLDDGDLSAGVSCPHVFHTACITSWLKKDHARSCPVCRNSFLGDEQPSLAATAPSSTSSIEPQRSATTAPRLAYPVRYPQIAHSRAIHPYLYVHNLTSLRDHIRSLENS